LRKIKKIEISQNQKISEKINKTFSEKLKIISKN